MGDAALLPLWIHIGSQLLCEWSYWVYWWGIGNLSESSWSRWRYSGGVVCRGKLSGITAWMWLRFSCLLSWGCAALEVKQQVQNTNFGLLPPVVVGPGSLQSDMIHQLLFPVWETALVKWTEDGLPSQMIVIFGSSLCLYGLETPSHLGSGTSGARLSLPRCSGLSEMVLEKQSMVPVCPVSLMHYK